MRFLIQSFLLMLLGSWSMVLADDVMPDPRRDILVTFTNEGASAIGTGVREPYRARKRYSIAASTRRHALAIAAAYELEEVDHWPIRSLAVYCFVYRVPENRDRENVIKLLQADDRIESVQLLQEFETGTDLDIDYNDTYVNLQHGLDALDVASAHRFSRGQGVRVAIIDSHADRNHEDLQGRIKTVKEFAADSRNPDNEHGTAIASVIGANANNARGIVGVAPEAELELYVSCWAEPGKNSAVCDSFTLAKALDTLFEDPPHVLNLSLVGPDDPLVRRLIEQVLQVGVIVVAADPANETGGASFPAHLDRVIGVGSSHRHPTSKVSAAGVLYAPGEQIMVAIPQNGYDFRSGSSLAAAHVSGVVALMLSAAPDLRQDDVLARLRDSQSETASQVMSVDACRALHHADAVMNCRTPTIKEAYLELQPGT